jgi:hypothetical protein
MGFNANSSDKQVVKEGKLYTGLANMKVVAINPTKDQLEALGYRPQNEPVYLTSEGEVKKVRLDVYLSQKAGDAEIRTKLAFFLENKVRVNQAGDKGEWINDFGRTAWGLATEAPTELKWFDAETARAARVGEGELHTFLINWLNINPNDEAKLDNFEGIFDGNYAELNSLLNGNLNNEVRVLLAVREGKYQSVYNRYFDRATNKRTSYWESHIKKQTADGYPPKEDFQSSFAFQEWREPSVMADAAVDGEEATADAGDPF